MAQKKREHHLYFLVFGISGHAIAISPTNNKTSLFSFCVFLQSVLGNDSSSLETLTLKKFDFDF